MRNVDEVKRSLQKIGMHMRPVQIDNERLMCTCDFRDDRVNVIIDKNIVTEVTGVG